MSEKGKIRKITDKGFGFIKYSEGEIFFHINDVSESDKEKIAVGGEVEFVIGKGKDGRTAAKQVRIKSHQAINNTPSENDSAENLYSIANTKLPDNTRECLRDKSFDIDNLFLKINKTANFIFNNEKRKDEVVLYKAEFKDKNKKLKKFDIGLDIKFSKDDFEKIGLRHKDSISQLLGVNNIKSSIFSPDWRLIIGIGHESVYEISITLHHIYGIPYIPGQAVKGVTRSWIITEVFNQDVNQDEKAALKDELFCRIFGSPKDSAKGEHQGSVMFFDAFPTVAPKIEVDIMNPHYGDYYQGKKPPADYLKPIPIPFLTVNATPFEFIIGMKKALTADKDSPLVQKADGLNEASTLVDVVQYWLKKALTEHGIGAKTAVGYGYMDVVELPKPTEV